ncbi:MAG: hypothetical protein LBR58_04795 [Propionibacteriaceae bacterium]|jgi:hypothetical protein|nr:hypothetical protein [Propionibacteriaceae bacterium]
MLQLIFEEDSMIDDLVDSVQGKTEFYNIATGFRDSPLAAGFFAELAKIHPGSDAAQVAKVKALGYKAAKAFNSEIIEALLAERPEE